MPHLETDVTTSCQLSCVACNHHVPLYRARGPLSTTAKQVEADLVHLSRIMHAQAWGALGGEPTLHHDLVGVLHAAKHSGVSDVVEVWTNGLTLRKQTHAFWTAFDVLVLSVYEGKHDQQSLDWIAKKCLDERRTLIIKDERSWHNFRTLFEPQPTNESETIRKYNGCFFRSFSRVANDGWFYTCCCAPHMPMLVQGREQHADGVPIDGLTEEGLRAYLNRRTPLGACANCAGRDTATPLQWHEEKNPARWLEASGMVAREAEVEQ